LGDPSWRIGIKDWGLKCKKEVDIFVEEVWSLVGSKKIKLATWPGLPAKLQALFFVVKGEKEKQGVNWGTRDHSALGLPRRSRKRVSRPHTATHLCPFSYPRGRGAVMVLKKKTPWDGISLVKQNGVILVFVFRDWGDLGLLEKHGYMRVKYR